jgi:LPS sulfotransferase NodH
LVRKSGLTLQPYLFIVGCARSGTTLLERLLNAHPLMAIAPEMHWITNAFRRRRWNASRCLVTHETLGNLVEHEMFPRFNISRDDFLRLVKAGKPIKGAKFMTGFFDLYRRASGKILVGTKTPSYIQRLMSLHRLWPETKFIHVIRDGRDVCLSVLDWHHAGRTAGRYGTWTLDPITTTALWWKRKVQLGQEAGRTLGPGLYYELRYEALIADPVDACASVCRFLGIPHDEAMLRFHEGPAPANEIDHPWGPIRDRTRDWRKQMPAETCQQFEAAAGDLLAELGYARAWPRVSPDVEKQVDEIRLRFCAEASGRGDRLPGLPSGPA